MKSDSSKALVILSGGQDSTTCLYWAIDRFGRDKLGALHAEEVGEVEEKEANAVLGGEFREVGRHDLSPCSSAL